VSDQWYTATSGSGSFHLTIAYKPARHETLTIDAFDLLKVIGKGSFGKVMQVRKKDTQRIYALKTIRKANIASRPGEITHILAERTVLALVNNPFIVPLKFSFQNPDKLYLVMSFGALRHTVQITVILSESLTSKRRRAVLSPTARGQIRRKSKPILCCRIVVRFGTPAHFQRCLP
jgi:serine/threonine protein kinase